MTRETREAMERAKRFGERQTSFILNQNRLWSGVPTFLADPTPGQSIDSLNASLAMMNKALKELRAAGFSIEVYGGHDEVSYHMSGGPS